jgi:hypothetical protein
LLFLNSYWSQTYFQKNIWVEITVSEGRKLVIDNHYFSRDVNVDIIKNYLNFFENILETLNYRAIFLLIFNVASFNGIVVYLPLTVTSALN